MRAVVYDRPESFTVREVPDPQPGPGEVRLRVTVAGVCGTDLHLHHGEFGPSYPLTPGHEFVGEVEAVGDGVDLAVGTVVVADNTTQCGTCSACRRGIPTYCTRTVMRGVNQQGSFAELIVVPEGNCLPIGDLDPEVAVFTEPTACVVHGLDVLELRPGSDVLLVGAGPTGLLMSQLLARSGAGRVVVSAPTQFKLDLAAEHGADVTVRWDRDDPDGTVGRLTELAPEGFDVVVDATGALPVLERSLELTRIRGTVFVYGMADAAARWPVSPYDVFRREITIKGSFSQYFAFDRALASLRHGRVDPRGMVTHRFSLDEYADALRAVADPTCLKAVVRP